MEVLPLHFKALSFCGLWSKSIKISLLQWVYKIFVISLVCYLGVAEVLEIILKLCLTTEDVTEGLVLPFTLLGIDFKMLNFLFNQEKILNIVEKFRKTICQPVSAEERAILENYTRKIDRIFATILTSYQVCGTAFLLLPFLENEVQNHTLPYKTYQPFKHSSTIPYYCTYTAQVFADFYAVCVEVSMDNLVFGFMFLICAQYDLLCHRLTTIGDEKEKFSLKEIIDHHVLIQDIIISIQKCFIKVVTPVFAFSLITFGASVFRITQVNILFLFTKCKKFHFSFSIYISKRFSNSRFHFDL